MIANRTLVAVAALMALTGCATIENGTEDQVAVVTDPPGANVSSSTGTFCTSPCTVSEPRKDAIAITITKPGYVTQTIGSQSLPTDALAAESRNEPSLDYLGRIVDVQYGSLYHHVPAAVVVKLEPAK